MTNILLLQHVVMLCKGLIDYLVPDRPKALQNKIRREHYIVDEYMLKAEATSMLKKHKLSLESGTWLLLSAGFTVV